MGSIQQYGPSQDLSIPAPWPTVLALGITLLFAGMITSATVSILGAVLCVTAFVGRFGKTLTREQREVLPVAPEPVNAVATLSRGDRVSRNARQGRLPSQVYPLWAGAKGGVAGSGVMAALALLYGLVSRHGVWYPINTLASGFSPAREVTEQTAVFHRDALIIASAVYLVGSLLVALLYVVTLPLCPRRPILWGGLIAPILWSGLIHSFLGTVNPALIQRMRWLPFVICQAGFGLVAGVFVSRQKPMRHAHSSSRGWRC
jgi:hypothetical protein